jgi:hypothetical protein
MHVSNYQKLGLVFCTSIVRAPNIKMHLLKITSFLAPLAVILHTTIAQSDTIDIAFYSKAGCDSGYIETRTVAVAECFALANNSWFGSYLVPSTIPDSLLGQGLQLEAGDTNPVDCDVGRYVLLSESLGCQPALSEGESAWWFGMLW